MRKLLNVAFFLGIILLIACEYTKVVPEPIPDTPVSFSADLIPIFDQKCKSCHAPGGTMPDLTPGNAYASLVEYEQFVPFNADASILYTKCATGGSMAMYCNSTDVQLIRNWINQGGENN